MTPATTAEGLCLGAVGMFRDIRCAHPPGTGAPGGGGATRRSWGRWRASQVKTPQIDKRSDLRPPGCPPKSRVTSRVAQACCGTRFVIYLPGVLSPVADVLATRICSTKRVRSSIVTVAKLSARFNGTILNAWVSRARVRYGLPLKSRGRSDGAWSHPGQIHFKIDTRPDTVSS